ncbi:MspA family porin [Nocardia sp. CA-128927]|uniref:MspA family porin n=1 Tax=Nocardia sp. CA-128927 TaxID=3239975 RepID=UPI003D99D7AF
MFRSLFDKKKLVVLVGAVVATAGAEPVAAAQFVDPAQYGLQIRHQVSAATLDGFQLMVTEANTTARSVPPLSGNPLSREGFVSSVAIGQVDGPPGASLGGATLDIGVEVGVPWSLQNIGVDVYTPSIGVNGGVNAGVTVPLTLGTSPSIGISPSVGASAGVTATVLPAQEVTFSVTPGSITEKSIAKLSLTSQLVYLDLSDIHLSVDGAIGPVTARLYTKLTLATAAGNTERTVYSDPIPL